ncbi:TetR/AcrR family transcriptional regulator [Enteractinococcus fodinae]|uniref:AcrR family transcriptional regulator n=1 Tax=Enteractinococcus fodinae TaxID=684663 RepID=A0ABU2B3K3_9MICC|nr:TetR/AcrR family transcriptional regulator [Enteractinococcus fodinae]MDR7347851.1 AcrR family transcriptional regulator [Enteractinococcus fodinae]
MESDTGTMQPAQAAQAARTQVRIRQLLDAAARLMTTSGSQSVSMQAVADEANVSVGLIYRYFSSKQQLVNAVIVGVLDDMAVHVPAATAQVDDPIRRLASALEAFIRVVDDQRAAVLLTYRESHTLDAEGLQAIKDAEIRTAQPLVTALREANEQGMIRPMNVSVFGYDLLMMAHTWALKHWYFKNRTTLDDYIADQIAIALSAALRPEHRQNYTDLLSDLT